MAKTSSSLTEFFLLTSIGNLTLRNCCPNFRCFLFEGCSDSGTTCVAHIACFYIAYEMSVLGNVFNRFFLCLGMLSRFLPSIRSLICLTLIIVVGVACILGPSLG